MKKSDNDCLSNFYHLLIPTLIIMQGGNIMLKLNSNVMAASVAEATQVAPGGCCCCCCCSCCVSVNTGSGSSSGGSPSLQLPKQ